MERGGEGLGSVVVVGQQLSRLGKTGWCIFYPVADLGR